MSRFFSEKYSALVPYTPGEQPRDMSYVKLNTNESPFSPHPSVTEAAVRESKRLQLYNDPESTALREALAAEYGVEKDMVITANGSDEVLNFAFMAFASAKAPLAFADITYGFYPVFAELNRIPYETVPLKEDLTLDPKDYTGINKTVVIANPNAPTGRCLPLSDIEDIVASNPNNVVIVDEAYVDFGAESAVCLVKKYENLLVTQTFSKYRSMAGARLGYGIGSKQIIADLNTIRYSTNPYNVNRVTEAAGVATLENGGYYRKNGDIIMENREWTTARLEEMGFEVIPSMANFIFARSKDISGEMLYSELKRRGVLVRHFSDPRICDHYRITIGTMEQMEILVEKIKEILQAVQQ